MKNKVTIIIVIFIFIISLIGINLILNTKNNNELSSKNSEKEEKMEIKQVTSKNFEEEVLKSNEKVLIDFYADWCGPCKMLSPIVEEVAKERTDIKVVKINIDEEQDLAIKYQVMSIPTLVVIENGNILTSSVGVIDKKEILEMLK